ncbi:hypothetical protein ACKWTF_005440 [Chironomus riparius]
MARQDILCRICVKEKAPMIPILEDNALNIHEKLLKLLKIKVFEKSQLPNRICLECLSKLNNFNEFFIQSNENQVILQVLFNEKPELSEIVPPKMPIPKTEISTQTDPSERYFIIEELTSEDNEQPQIQIVTEDEISQEARDEENYDVTIEADNSFAIKDEQQMDLGLNASKKRNRYDRFDCYLCNQQMAGNFLFLKHFATSHPKQEVRYQCYVCKGFVKKYRSYTRHLESHDEKRFECDVCNQKFSQKITLITHLSSHSTVKRFECTECNLSFKQNSSLFKHRKQKHTNEVPTCEQCNRTFVNKMTFEQHLKSKHNQESKDIACDNCKKKFASKSALAYHRLSNHTKSDQDIKCENCFEEFKNKIILARHKKKCGK